MDRIKQLADQGHYEDCFLMAAQDMAERRTALHEAERALRKAKDRTIAAYLLNPLNGYKFGHFTPDMQRSFGKNASQEFYCGGPENEKRIKNMGWEEAYCSLAIPEEWKLTEGAHRYLSPAIVEAMEDLAGKPMAMLIAAQAPNRPVKIIHPIALFETPIV